MPAPFLRLLPIAVLPDLPWPDRAGEIAIPSVVVVNCVLPIPHPIPLESLERLILRCGRHLAGSAPAQITLARSRYRQKAFASCICRGVLHCASKTEGEATNTQMHLAREVATLSRFRL